ncbi:hypothetical protein NUU61_004482 [Penicillium alfredii]|uniref:Sulfatase N-terminal domain-containing protein n=1 Tax=Penicillium alfredii TaxID=1506179 RepID=A0A9W9FLS5_9EURO|nr:uncharacterized protein NUU61_004482 [Penicillium alfredii]KAJ5102260.1 hypothetical protein NUU61_004482 [Penicillium alfredii]
MNLCGSHRWQDVVRLVLSPSFWFDRCWPGLRKYCFSLALISAISAKCLHIYSHITSLYPSELFLWGPTFFVQDIICILLVHTLCRNWQRRWVRAVSSLPAIFLSVTISGLAAANIYFYVETGAEIHWRQARGFHGDVASVKTLLTGMLGVGIVEVVFFATSYFATPHLYNGVEILVDTIVSYAAMRNCWRRKQTTEDAKSYEQVALQDSDDEDSDPVSLNMEDPMEAPEPRSRLSRVLGLLAVGCTVFLFLLRCARPSDPTYMFLSQTVIVGPLDKGKSSSEQSVQLPKLEGDYSWLGNHTALAPPPKLDWLPAKELEGFRDWYQSADNKKAPVHYDPKKDPLHISNLDSQVIEPLREALKSGNVNIKHILLFKLESTREDVFPLRKESDLFKIISETYGGNQVPPEVEARLANLTRTAEKLTGTRSGFNDDEKTFKPYGGLHAKNAYTAATFTLKSITASVCGLLPLVMDFSREYNYHIYQPCMPHILGALNTQLNNTPTTDNYTSWPWRSKFMQSITDHYDNQDLLLPALGFNDTIAEDQINEDLQKKGKPLPEKMNFWGYPESRIRDYFLNAFKEAEEKHERLFIGHLTGITHHPWDTPSHEYNELIGSPLLKNTENVNRYLNTVGLGDQWIQDVLNILEEAGVANETLFVMAGDHGIALPENNGLTPYDNPHVANFHVPLVLAHPQLPQVDIDPRVTSMQIVPTVLDLLVESSSLDEQSAHAIKDLLPMYEGQSMIRPLIPEKDGVEDWQFSVMNTGATWLALRSATKPYRLIVPLVADVEWRFSDIEVDPHELDYLMSFDLLALMKQVKRRHGEDAMKWINDAAHVAEWWVKDNWRRYEYVPS